MERQSVLKKQVAQHMKRLAKHVRGFEAMAVELGGILPNFEVVEFHEMIGDPLSINGKGRYTNSQEELVQNDINTAEAFARWLEKQYGCSAIVNFETTNQILDLTITVHGFLSLEQENEIREMLKQFMLKDM